MTKGIEVRTFTVNKHLCSEAITKRFQVSKTSMVLVWAGVRPFSKDGGSPTPPIMQKNGKVHRIPCNGRAGVGNNHNKT